MRLPRAIAAGKLLCVVTSACLARHGTVVRVGRLAEPANLVWPEPTFPVKRTRRPYDLFD